MSNKETQNDKHIVGISAIMKTTGMTRIEILHHIEKGNIHASKEKERFVFGHNEMLRLKKLNRTHIGLWQIVRGLLKDDAKHVKTKFKREFLEFAFENNWFGAKPISANDVYFSSIKGEEYFLNMIDAKRTQDRISLWINSYGCSSAEKLKLLLNRMSVEHPRTSKLLNTFLEDNKADKTPAWKLTDYLCSKLKCEITDMSDEMIEDMISAMDTELQLNTARLFTEFLIHLKEHGFTKSSWTYNFLPRYKKENNNAYQMQVFIQMAYIIFNEESWRKRGLMDKVLSSRKYAELWLFISLHFICGWRGSDIVRLPMPSLHLEGENIRRLIKENEFDCLALLDEVEFRLKYVSMKPSKTENHTNIPQLKLFVPESLRIPISLVLSIAASWNECKLPGEQFIRGRHEVEDIEKFFGSDFVFLCNNKRFSTRRANKAYLQGIEMIANNDNPGKPKGYMLAALARSHKGGLGRLPETTEIYLKDANFSGYTPDFIAKEMFERGVFSFIPYLMLEMYSGGAYKKLNISSRTSLIADMGIKPSGLENMTRTVEASLSKARNIISKIMNYPEDIRGTTAEILQNIASGNAASKQEGCMCLLTAANFPCIYPDRGCCVGCGYEIYTKAILQSLIREYRRLIERKKNSSVEEATRCSKILKSAIMPAIIEIIISIRNINPDYDIFPILEKMKGGYLYV